MMETQTQIRVVIFATIFSLLLAALLPILVPVQGMDAEDVEKVMAQRSDLQSFTGQSMINQAPFRLEGVYTPYIPGQSANNTTDDGVLYGEKINPYVLDGVDYTNKVSDIKLDPEHKSSSMLISDKMTVTDEFYTYKDWAQRETDNPWIAAIFGLEYWIHTDVLNEDTRELNTVDHTYNVWNYSGYRYVFKPSLTVDYDTEKGTESTDKMSLSIVWYDIRGTEGISGGLVIYESKPSRAPMLIANLTADEIIANYDSYTNKASVYTLAFDGLPMKMAIRFDPLVMDGSEDMLTAWHEGDWSIGFYAASIHNFLDRDNSLSYDLSLGSMVDTYTQVFTLSYPNLGGGWDVVVLILCALPMLIVLLSVLVEVVGAIRIF